MNMEQSNLVFTPTTFSINEFDRVPLLFAKKHRKISITCY